MKHLKNEDCNNSNCPIHDQFIRLENQVKSDRLILYTLITVLFGGISAFIGRMIDYFISLLKGGGKV